MRRITITFALVFGTLATTCWAQESFSAAAFESIRRAAPGVEPEQIHFLAIPRLSAPLRSVVIKRANFDRAMGKWQLELKCEPRPACITTLATVASRDEDLFPRQVARPKRILIHAGDRKRLTSRSELIIITVPVTCLEAGAAGDEIKVRDSNSRRILLALVQSDGSIILRSPR